MVTGEVRLGDVEEEVEVCLWVVLEEGAVVADRLHH